MFHQEEMNAKTKAKMFIVAYFKFKYPSTSIILWAHLHMPLWCNNSAWLFLAAFYT